MSQRRLSDYAAGVPAGAHRYAVSGGGLPALTPKEQELLTHIQAFMDREQILKAMKIKERRLRDLLASLKSKGYVSHYAGTMPRSGTSLSVAAGATVSGRYRAHAFTLSLPVYSPDERYRRQVQRRNAKTLDGNGVVLYPRGIVIHGQEGLSFYGRDANEAFWNAHKYWSNFITRLENKYHIVLRKAGGEEFQVACEMADTANGFAAKAVSERQFWLVRDDETGKPIVKIDFSGKVFEFETVDSRTATEDMQKWGGPLMNDYRKHKEVFRKPSETWAQHDELLADVRRLEAVVERLAVMQQSFYETQGALTRAKVKMLERRVPKSITEQKPDYTELRRYTG